MSEDIKAVLADLGKAFHEFKAENDLAIAELKKKGSTDPLLAEKVDKINASVEEFSVLKAEIEKMQNIIARGNYGGGEGTNPAVAEHTKAFEKFFRKGVEAGLVDLEVKAALRSDSDPDGGYTVPTEMESTIDRIAQSVSAMRGLANQMNISAPLYKKLVNMGGATSGWVGETSLRPETSTPTLKELTINTQELYANPAITQTALDDSAINIGQWLADEVVIEFTEQEADAFINGNGVEKPHGILKYTTIADSAYAWGKVGYIAGGAASTFTNLDKMIDLQAALKPVYRNGATLLMAESTQTVLRKFKDGDGAYIWRPGLMEGAPNVFLGKPIVIDDNMPAIGAGTFPIAYANFKRAYLIVDRIGIRVLRDPYTNKPYVMFYTTKRVGGGIVMYEAIKLLKIAAS